jgi:hypothetical protein
VAFGAPDSLTCAVGQSAKGHDGPVIYPDCSVMPGEPFGGLCVTSDCPCKVPDSSRSCLDYPAVLRADLPHSEDDNRLPRIRVHRHTIIWLGLRKPICCRYVWRSCFGAQFS